jgi:phage tail protein X
MFSKFVLLRLQGVRDPFMSMANGKSDPPPPPDYIGAANATAAGNVEAARATAAANRTNQVTPYGNLTYSANPGTDAYGNTLYTATQTLSPEQQATLNQQNQLNTGLMTTANKGLNYANDVLSQPGVDTSKLPSIGINPGQSYQDAIMSRLSPQMARENQSSDAQLANQGIAQGTEAYNNAKTLLQQGQNDRLTSATTQGMNMGLAANQQGFNQAAYNQMQPINVINALRTGSQVQNPSYAATPQQANTAGPDILGATNAQYTNQLNATNAANAASGNFMGGLMGLGASVMQYSDEHLKTDIKRIGTHDLGMGIYTYHYKDGYNLPTGIQVGVMAQEVEKVIPEAVIVTDSGFKAVNYAML